MAKVFKNKFGQVIEKSSVLILCLFGFVKYNFLQSANVSNAICFPSGLLTYQSKVILVRLEQQERTPPNVNVKIIFSPFKLSTMLSPKDFVPDSLKHGAIL